LQRNEHHTQCQLKEEREHFVECSTEMNESKILIYIYSPNFCFYSRRQLGLLVSDRILKNTLKGNALVCDSKETRIALARMIGFINCTAVILLNNNGIEEKLKYN